MATEPRAIVLRPAGVPVTTADRPGHLPILVGTLAALTSTLLMPVGLLGIVVLAALASAVGVKLAATPVRTGLATQAARRALMTRRFVRARALAPSSYGRLSLEELTNVVDEIDPEVARRFDLEGLLDRHVRLTLAYEQAQRAAAMTDRGQLERIRDGYRSDPPANPRRLELCERRLELVAECEERVDRLADELAIVSDLIRLIAQRASLPDDLPADDTIARHLAGLDADAHQVTDEL